MLVILFTKLGAPSTVFGKAAFHAAALVPAYRCETTVADVVRGLFESLDEVLVVDDGSRDGTSAAARGAGATVLVRAENGGKGTAVRDGLRFLLRRPDLTHVAFVDADGQHDPGELPRLLDAARGGADFVIGSRLRDPRGMPAKNYWANAIGDKILARMSGLAVEDGQSGYRVIATSLLRPLHLVSRRYAIENEILVKAAPKVTRLAIAPIKTIYAAGPKHYRPFRDTWITSWLTVYYKTLGAEG